ncbi:phage tail sheath subtilisin-like domain-containing protein [Lachnospiraceae bacterium 54-53]
MGLPEIIISFQTMGVTAIARSSRGIVAVILSDDTADGQELNIYNSITDVNFTHWTQRNYEYLKLIYAGGPSRVIALRKTTAAADFTAQLEVLKDLRWNYLTIPGITAEHVPVISAWIKGCREDNHKTFKAVLPNSASDHEGIINYTTDGVKSTLSETIFTVSEYCARMAGILAGLSLQRSATYYVLTDVTEAAVPTDPDDRIDAGQLILVFDGEKYKIGRGVNSLVTFTADKGEDFSSIKIMEGIDLYQDDLKSAFEESYVGKVINDYDNKQAFIAAIRAYQKTLAGNVLDASYDNTAAIDVEAQRSYLEGQGIDTSAMDDTAVAMYNTRTKVFVSSDVKFVDAMEDLHLVVTM